MTNNITPASWAKVEAELALYQGNELAPAPEDEKLLVRLGQDARDLDFEDGQYFVETSRALSIPASFEADRPVSYINFSKLSFEGVFRCYSKVMVGRVIGVKSVRAFCLTFDENTLLPYFNNLPEDHLLYVPILAVDSMERTG